MLIENRKNFINGPVQLTGKLFHRQLFSMGLRCLNACSFPVVFYIVVKEHDRAEGRNSRQSPNDEENSHGNGCDEFSFQSKPGDLLQADVAQNNFPIKKQMERGGEEKQSGDGDVDATPLVFA
jgi:hypothetical protein